MPGSRAETLRVRRQGHAGTRKKRLLADPHRYNLVAVAVEHFHELPNRTKYGAGYVMRDHREIEEVLAYFELRDELAELRKAQAERDGPPK